MAGRAIQRDEARERVCTALAAGNTRRAACAFAGISEDTLANWLRRHSDFAEAVKKAEGDAEVRNVAIISRAAQQGTWQAAAWWLERRYPHDYGRSVQEVQHSGTIDTRHSGTLEIRAVDYRIAAAALLTDGTDAEEAGSAE